MSDAAAAPTQAKPPSSRAGRGVRSAMAPTKTSRTAQMIVESVTV